jgi:hypothetical protein
VEAKALYRLCRSIFLEMSCPDITPLDFFLWGYVKSSVFRTPVNRIDDLKTHIRNVILAIPADMLHRTWQELEYCLDVLHATKGAHIEVY